MKLTELHERPKFIIYYINPRERLEIPTIEQLEVVLRTHRAWGQSGNPLDDYEDETGGSTIMIRDRSGNTISWHAGYIVINRYGVDGPRRGDFGPIEAVIRQVEPDPDDWIYRVLLVLQEVYP